MYEQSSCPGAESNSIKDTDKPDEFGLILNDKKYRGKVRAPKDGVYVNENLALALRQVLQQQSTLKEAAQIYDVDQTTMCRKLRELKKRRFSNSNLPSLQFKTAGSEQIKEKKIHSFVNMESFPQISVHNSIQKIIRKMNQANQVSFPRSFNECIKRIEGGENVEEMIQYYALNKVVAVKIIRFLKQAKKSSRSVYDILVKKVASLLPYLNGSNSPSVSPCKDAQSFMQVTTKHVIPQSTSRFVSYTSQDLKKAIDYYNSGGSSIKYVSAKFNVPYGRLCKSLRKTEQVMEKWKKPDASPDHSQSLSPSSSSAIMGCVGAVSKVTSCKSPKEKHAQKTLCLFCHGKAGNEVELGKLHILNKIIVHYYCLLFSSALEQNGQDDEGILGFLPKDILKELKRGKKLKCFHCRKNGATIGCYRKNCKRVYHFPCGLQNHAQFVFTDNFRSLCPNHRKFQRANNIDQEVECPICLQVMVADPKIAVWAPCCKKSSWFHKICIQRLALHAGYFFKCPLCNDKDTFIPEMRQNGIYVPEQDASWELEPNAYQELLERPIRCLAEVCKCPGGRKNDEEGTTWEVVLCNLCGSSGVHVSCGKLRRGQSTWNCNTCTTMLKECELRKQSLGRISLQEKRAEVDSGSDEEVQFPSARKRRRTDFHLNSPHIIKISYSSHDEHVVVDSDSGTDVSPQDLARASSSGFRPLSRCGAVKENKGVIGMDDDVFVPRSISGNVMIADLVQRGEIPLPECLLDLKTYAEGFPLKLNKLRFDEDTFLLKLREVSSESKSDPPYEVTKEHLSRFVRCTFTYDQMRLLRKVFELCFIIHEFKLKISRYQKNVRNDPFKTRRRTGNRNPSLVKKVKGLQMKLVSLLSQASEVNLLEAYNTWTQYDSTSNKYWTSVASSHSRNLTTDGIASTSSDIPSASSSARYIRRIEVNKLEEECAWCNTQLMPGLIPTTVVISTGDLEVICSACATLNVFCNLFPPVLSSSTEAASFHIGEPPRKGALTMAKIENPFSQPSGDKAKLSWGGRKKVEESRQGGDKVKPSKGAEKKVQPLPSHVGDEVEPPRRGVDKLEPPSDLGSKKMEPPTQEGWPKLEPLTGPVESLRSVRVDKVGAKQPSIVYPKSLSPRMPLLNPSHNSSGDGKGFLGEPSSSATPRGQNTPLVITVEPPSKRTPSYFIPDNKEVSNGSTLSPNKIFSNSLTCASVEPVSKEFAPRVYTSMSKPPVHSPLNISLTDAELCQTCSVYDDNLPEKRPLVNYCPCCVTIPNFCSEEHFNDWHEFTHNWLRIPPISGNSKPQLFCKMCPEDTYTKYYCPACPDRKGYCSQKHYDAFHRTASKGSRDGEVNIGLAKEKKNAKSTSNSNNSDEKMMSTECSGGNKKGDHTPGSSLSNGQCILIPRSQDVIQLKHFRIQKFQKNSSVHPQADPLMAKEEFPVNSKLLQQSELHSPLPPKRNEVDPKTLADPEGANTETNSEQTVPPSVS